MSDSKTYSNDYPRDFNSASPPKQRSPRTSLDVDLNQTIYNLEGTTFTQGHPEYEAVSVSEYVASENAAQVSTNTVSSGMNPTYRAVVGTVDEFRFSREVAESRLNSSQHDRVVITDDLDSNPDQTVVVRALIRAMTKQDSETEPSESAKYLVYSMHNSVPSNVDRKVAECDTFNEALIVAAHGESAISRELISINAVSVPAKVNTKIRALVVCNAYPSNAQIYRNGFIHSRVEKYVESGIDVDVYYLHEPATQETEYTYRGINVTLGNAESYRKYLSDSSYDVYLVHFATQRMIEPIKEYAPNNKAIVWIHGFEAEAWHRRWFNFLESPDSMAKILEMKDGYYREQTIFNKELYRNASKQFHFVNVSDWFKTHIVEPDSGVKFRPRDSSTIPNLIDGEFFDYRKKEAGHRTKILSIRPFASHKYANDLTVDAIVQLSEKPWFEHMEFTICGHGRLFKDVTKRLNGFNNVRLLNRFLTREEIRNTHSNHGVFLAPTRFDSQGVSTNEAMASGLVPISSDVSAIPEFISHFESGLLARRESSNELAYLIELLYFDSELFQKLSRGAAIQIRETAGYGSTAAEEIRLIQDCVGFE